MKTKRLLIPIILLISCACQNSAQFFQEETKEINSSNNTISKEAAIADLLSFMSAGNYRHTKSDMGNESIKSIESVYFDIPAELDAQNDKGPKVYLVDFYDGSSAIIGADVRAPGVYAILDNSSFKVSDFASRTETTSKAITEDGISYVTEENAGMFIASYIRDYVVLQIAMNKEDSLETKGTPFNGHTWFYEDSYGPLMTTIWGQGAPLNSVTIQNEGEGSHTGCGAIAIAQLMRFFHYPSSINYEPINWGMINPVYSYSSTGSLSTGTVEHQEEAAGLVYTVAVDLNTNFSTGSSTIFKAKWLLGALGFTVSEYTFADSIPMDGPVIQAIMDGRPAFYRGAHRVGFLNYEGHSWVVDGYRQYFYISSNVVHYMDTYHVNWGWYGLHNGWYRIDLFNPSASMVEGGSYGDTIDLLSEACGYTFQYDNIAFTLQVP